MGGRDYLRCGCILLMVWVFGGIVLGIASAFLVGFFGTAIGLAEDAQLELWRWVAGALNVGAVVVTFCVLLALEVRKTHKRLHGG